MPNEITDEHYKQIITLGSMAGVQSLMFCKPQVQGNVYFLTEKRFSAVHIGRSTSIENPEGELLTSDLESFIDDKLTEPNCQGIVPLTKEVMDMLEKKGAKMVASGASIAEYRYRAALFAYQ